MHSIDTGAISPTRTFHTLFLWLRLELPQLPLDPACFCFRLFLPVSQLRKHQGPRRTCRASSLALASASLIWLTYGNTSLTFASNSLCNQPCALEHLDCPEAEPPFAASKIPTSAIAVVSICRRMHPFQVLYLIEGRKVRLIAGSILRASRRLVADLLQAFQLCYEIEQDRLSLYRKDTVKCMKLTSKTERDAGEGSKGRVRSNLFHAHQVVSRQVQQEIAIDVMKEETILIRSKVRAKSTQPLRYLLLAPSLHACKPVLLLLHDRFQRICLLFGEFQLSLQLFSAQLDQEFLAHSIRYDLLHGLLLYLLSPSPHAFAHCPAN
eukprot:767374-Hanusia_phi.AAC.1